MVFSNAPSKNVGGFMQLAAAGRLLHCIAITLVIFFASVITAAAALEGGQLNPHQRILNTWMADDDGCHQGVLSNPLQPGFTLVRGVIFSLRSNGASTSVSSLSVFLDEKASTPSVGFDIFTTNGDGMNSIGTTLDGSGAWKRIHSGTIADTQLEDDDATFLGSFGPLVINAGETKSIYLRFTETVLRVTSSTTNANGWDGGAVNLNDNNMKVSIGRAVSACCNTEKLCSSLIYFIPR
mmetsp:Transcript_28455/g.48352  ORF Transcript_28455/g.48352 Transcript_28455/m.48352 type:complete len:238 (+) Transcript_28455:106-819(+)